MTKRAIYPLWIALASYCLITGALLCAGLVRNQGQLIYPLDDTYIHMAMAKHFVGDGIWGVTQSGFSSSTSSPLWTFLIAVTYWLFGVGEWSPLALSFACGNLTLVASYFILRTLSPLKLTIVLEAIVLFVPLPILTLTGMEHILHGALTLCFVYCATALLLQPRGRNGRTSEIALLLLLSCLLSAIRYEGLFLILLVSLLFAASGRLLVGALVVATGALFVSLYGFWSTCEGCYFLPNSVLLKGNIPGFTLLGMFIFVSRFLYNWFCAPHILFLVVVCLLAFLRLNIKWHEILRSRPFCLVLLFSGAAILHMLFASTGWFYRYESYLVLLGCVILASIHSAAGAVSQQKSSIMRALCAGLLLAALLWRTGKAACDYPLATANVFEQQYQLGLFVNQYYNGKIVAVHDIGAISYLSNASLVDLFGLASMDVAKARRLGTYGADWIADYISKRDVEIVIVYNSWFLGHLPSEWEELGRWKISNNVVCGSDTVSFYVPNSLWRTSASNNLRAFSSKLPTSIQQSGRYLE